jgi:hypothetical protein
MCRRAGGDASERDRGRSQHTASIYIYSPQQPAVAQRRSDAAADLSAVAADATAAAKLKISEVPPCFVQNAGILRCAQNDNSYPTALIEKML